MTKANHLSGIFDVLRPLAWIALVSFVALSSRAIGHDWLLLVGLWLALAVAAGLWAARQPWIKDAKRPFERRAGIVLSILFVPILTYLVALFAGVALERTSAERYTSAREAFMTDLEGFPFIKSFALEHYGVHIVLASAVSGWATSSVALPHAGAAFMSVGPGYCELTLNRANVLRRFNGDDPSSWVKGVMVHELAHCLDVSRDMPAFTGREIGTRSIAPSEAGEVVDLEGHLDAATRLPTQRWREALADVFAVGFWRMTEAGASDIVADLVEKRGSGDAAHATSCWIQHAAVEPLPPTFAGLLPWADEIRTKAHCAL